MSFTHIFEKVESIAVSSISACYRKLLSTWVSLLVASWAWAHQSQANAHTISAESQISETNDRITASSAESDARIAAIHDEAARIAAIRAEIRLAESRIAEIDARIARIAEIDARIARLQAAIARLHWIKKIKKLFRRSCLSQRFKARH